MLPMFEHHDSDRAREIFTRLKAKFDDTGWRTTVQGYKREPFRALMGSMLSARTKEEETKAAMNNLFALADNPADMANLSYEAVLRAISPVTYPENKANYVLKTAAMLTEMGGEVPRTVDELTQFPGVGWKSAVLTLWIAYGLAPEICVDVHVGRIGKRLGFVNSKTSQPQKISRELMQIVPRDIWGAWNPAMVNFGRNICYPTVPACDQCPIYDLCERVGVKTRTVKSSGQ